MPVGTGIRKPPGAEPGGFLCGDCGGSPPPPRGRGLCAGGCAPCTPLAGLVPPHPMPPKKGGGGFAQGAAPPAPRLRGLVPPHPMPPKKGGGGFSQGAAPPAPRLRGWCPHTPCPPKKGEGALRRGLRPLHPACGAYAPHLNLMPAHTGTPSAGNRCSPAPPGSPREIPPAFRRIPERPRASPM